MMASDKKINDKLFEMLKKNRKHRKTHDEQYEKIHTKIIKMKMNTNKTVEH